MTTLERAIRIAIPLVEAQTGAQIVVWELRDPNYARIEIVLSDERYEGDYDFATDQKDFEGWVYEVLIASVESIADDELGSVS